VESEKGRSDEKGERAGRDVHMSNESAGGKVQEDACKCARSVTMNGHIKSF
jgi:hypothetical protein